DGIKEALISPANSGAIDNTDFFVRQQYKDFLNRDPDEAGWRFWNITLYTCGAPGPGTACYQSRRADVSAAFFLSTEFQQTGYLVYRTYKAAYGNLPGALVPNKFNEFLPDTQEIGRGVIVNEGNWQQQLEANKQAFFSEFVQRGKNLFDGVTISDGASNNTIGGTPAGAGNTIAANGNDIEYHSIAGVAVIAGTGNAILGNSIFSNAHNPFLFG